MAAIHAAEGWENSAYATEELWYYDDGGGNWACLRFTGSKQAVLFGHDHECSRTYFRNAAKEFGEKETNLLADAPDWWGNNIEPPEYGPYIGFIYGWDGHKWWRANYTENDGFKQVGLIRAISIFGRNSLSDFLVDMPERARIKDLWTALKAYILTVNRLRTLIAADANISEEMLDRIVKRNSQAGVAAAKNFLKVNLD